MKNTALTLTVIANMTSNYGEGLGNISSVQKVYRGGKEYATRSRESLKNAICVQAGLYDDLQTSVDGAMQKLVTKDINAATCKALEGGYMSTKDVTYIRNSSFYLTDAVSVEPFISDARFHNNLYLATNFAKANGLNVQNDSKDCGLMPYQYEYDKSIKIYSITIDLEKVGVDQNFDAEASNEEKCSRVLSIIDAVENLSLVVKGNLDNAEPIFIAGGLSPRKTHMFENAVRVVGKNLVVEPIKEKLEMGFSCGLMRNGQLGNEDEIVRELNPTTVPKFFNQLREDVKAYFAD
ncbi:MAG: type I-B CRISPR-associated protein Cas7/Cst2/DevR [Ruminococcus sp.]|nr:type I-B CRISPR-associated protein Cas7/Cst2/DevR [Ruminococcus sp.]MCI6504964.1 type I-B CRISPR-associated protein Cas7/Cst2/DevR [Ruminococcus sp.]MDD6710330.1 type I-B CRISPR-associated protein Cas7/Cst2/DevR [Ruminococcus sp.]